MRDLINLVLAAAFCCVAMFFFILAIAYPSFGLLSFLAGMGVIVFSFRVLP